MAATTPLPEQFPMVRRLITKVRLLSAVVGTAAVAAGAGPALAEYVPHGSYASSCRDIHKDGPYLYAYCARVDGSWHYTRVFVPRCGGGNISNQDGHLTCGE
jgi:hypothetical protein